MRRGLIAVLIGMSAVVLIACGSDGTDVPTEEVQGEPKGTSTPPAADTPTSVVLAVTEEVEVAEQETDSGATEVPAPTEAPTPTEKPTVEMAPERDLDIVTLLPFDGIQSIDSPGFFPDLEKANMFYKDHELVLGVEIDGDARAYSVPLLSSHEIVNDVVGGEPIAVTW